MGYFRITTFQSTPLWVSPHIAPAINGVSGRMVSVSGCPPAGDVKFLHVAAKKDVSGSQCNCHLSTLARKRSRNALFVSVIRARNDYRVQRILRQYNGRGGESKLNSWMFGLRPPRWSLHVSESSCRSTNARSSNETGYGGGSGSSYVSSSYPRFVHKTPRRMFLSARFRKLTR